MDSETGLMVGTNFDVVPESKPEEISVDKTSGIESKALILLGTYDEYSYASYTKVQRWFKENKNVKGTDREQALEIFYGIEQDRPAQLCEVCCTSNYKYKCPWCKLKFCAFTCWRSHGHDVDQPSKMTLCDFRRYQNACEEVRRNHPEYREPPLTITAAVAREHEFPPSEHYICRLCNVAHLKVIVVRSTNTSGNERKRKRLQGIPNMVNMAKKPKPPPPPPSQTFVFYTRAPSPG